MKLIKHLFASVLILGTATAFAAEKPTKSEAKTEQAVQTQTKTQEAQAQPVQTAVVNQVNINTATASELQKALIGIGAKKAEAIVQYREKHGAFTAAEQLMEVQGIGKATFEKNKERIIF